VTICIATEHALFSHTQQVATHTPSNTSFLRPTRQSTNSVSVGFRAAVFAGRRNTFTRTKKAILSGQILPSFWGQKANKLSASWRLCPYFHDQGLHTWSPLGAMLPDPVIGYDHAPCSSFDPTATLLNPSCCQYAILSQLELYTHSADFGFVRSTDKNLPNLSREIWQTLAHPCNQHTGTQSDRPSYITDICGNSLYLALMPIMRAKKQTFIHYHRDKDTVIQNRHQLKPGMVAC